MPRRTERSRRCDIFVYFSMCVKIQRDGSAGVTGDSGGGGGSGGGGSSGGGCGGGEWECVWIESEQS